MKRRRALRVTQRNEDLVPCIQALKAEPPFWGYRRFADHRPVNSKRGLCLMQEHQLVGAPNLRLKAKRTPPGGNPQPTRPNAWWGIEMTKVLIAGFGGVDIVRVWDWYTKKIVGHNAGLRCTPRHWLAALEMAVNRQFPSGIRAQGLSRMRDNPCQPTSIAFMKRCATLEIHQAFTRDNNPKGKADTERVMRTVQEECLWLQEWRYPVTLVSTLETWIDYENERYRHAALVYRPPKQCERKDYSRHSPPFAAA